MDEKEKIEKVEKVEKVEKDKNQDSADTFERDIGRLEHLVAELEKGDIPLERMLELFEQGVGLSKNCAAMLDKAEKRVRLLTRREGEPVKEEFADVAEGESR